MRILNPSNLDDLSIDDFDDIVTSTFANDLNTEGYEDEDDFYDPSPIPFSDPGEAPFEVREDSQKKGHFADITISGYTILNHCGNKQLKGNATQSFLLQKICSTSSGVSIPLFYPEAMLLPSIFWKAAEDSYSILGAIPVPLLREGIGKYGFEDISRHIWLMLTSPLCSTSTNPRFISFCYDMVVNVAVNRDDNRRIINNGLAVSDDKLKV